MIVEYFFPRREIIYDLKKDTRFLQDELQQWSLPLGL